MAKNDRLGASILAVKLITNVSPDLFESYKLKPGQRTLGLVTGDCDDVTYTALDEATKMVKVEVVYARSFYGGAANSNTKLAGEVLGIIAGPSPAEVRSALDVVIQFVNEEASFYSANDDNTISYYAHCISRTGSYLSKVANVPEGASLAYLIAPPLEAMYALDAALKATDVKLSAFYGPPSETNFGGGLLTGSQSSCEAACNAFADAVKYIADNPLSY